MIYIQHSYNKVVHTYTSKSPFETCFGYFSFSPLDVVYGHQGVMEYIIGEPFKEKKLVENIRQIRLQVQEMLNK